MGYKGLIIQAYFLKSFAHARLPDGVNGVGEYLDYFFHFGFDVSRASI